jgi:hypothetical protein
VDHRHYRVVGVSITPAATRTREIADDVTRDERAYPNVGRSSTHCTNGPAHSRRAALVDRVPTRATRGSCGPTTHRWIVAM